ncbi:MAG: hypothetical protein HY824_15915 [Acidobacteria bacterium]|nr:hypothetical protein [Acidobacteriota bacterium]
MRGALMPPRGWTWAALGLAGALALGLSWVIVHSPLTLYDGLAPILNARRSPSVIETFTRTLDSAGYWRPLRLVQIKVLFDLFPSDPTPVFKAVHVALVFAATLLFALWLRPRSVVEFTAAATALMIVVGHHSFLTLISEEYPINHFLEMMALTIATALLARGAPRWWKDLLVPLLLVAGLLTLEMGILIAVAAVACWMVGWRGVSGRGVAACLVVVALYLWVRFGVLHVPSPGLDERETGWWLERLQPEEIVARFGSNPLPFYAYNLMAALLDVLLSQPRAGTWYMARAWLDHDIRPWMVIHLVSSALVSGALLVSAVAALNRWRRAALEERDRFVLVALALVSANTALSYGYVKDEVLSVGAAFYAAGAFAVLAHLGARVRERSGAHLAAAVLLVCVSSLWSVRAAGTFFGVRSSVYKTATDWGRFSLERDLPEDWELDATRRLFLELRQKNVGGQVPSPAFTNERYVQRYVEIQ